TPESLPSLHGALPPIAFDSFPDEFRLQEDEIEQPGFLWFADKPTFAILVGLSRAVCQEKDVTLIGITHCQHRIDENHAHYYDVINSGGRLIRRRSTIFESHAFSSGLILSHIDAEQLESAFIGKFPLRLIELLQKFQLTKDPLKFSSQISGFLTADHINRVLKAIDTGVFSNDLYQSIDNAIADGIERMRRRDVFNSAIGHKGFKELKDESLAAKQKLWWYQDEGDELSYESQGLIVDKLQQDYSFWKQWQTN
ncbi:hypothetical protein COY14_04300, partial [Candidatus Roizmanbacteria bacterium CG_4_10_14_0_2_um_filter_36_9]